MSKTMRILLRPLCWIIDHHVFYTETGIRCRRCHLDLSSVDESR
jgi:hypothetical protein